MATFQTTYTEAPAIGLPGQVANTELLNKISRVVESATALEFGQPAYRGTDDRGCVVGGTFAAIGASAALGTNTGNGTMGAITVTAGAKQGVYVLTITESAANAGNFIVEDPNGVQVGDGTVGVAFSADGLAFTLADGATDFVAGDSFAITVTYTANVGFIGLAVLYAAVLDKATTPDSYERYETAALMTLGTMYVTAGATVTAGQPVYWNPATKRYTNTATHIAIPGAVFDTSGVDGDIVEITLKLR